MKIEKDNLAMGTKTEFEWEKYEKRFAELENRISCPSRLKPSASNNKSNDITDCFGKHDSQKHEETVVLPAVRDSSSYMLAEEVRFLKAEIAQLAQIKEESLKLKYDIANIASLKDSEIARLFARNRLLEEENNGLKLKISRYNFDTAESFREREHRHHKKEGLLGWLKKPMLVIEPE